MMIQKTARHFTKAILLLFAYALTVIVFRLINLTFITFFSIPSLSTLSDLSSFSSVFHILAFAAGAASFVIIWTSLYPSRHNSAAVRKTWFSRAFKSIKGFAPGFLQGQFTAGCLVIAFFLAGIYQYLGAFMHYEETYSFVVNFGLKFISISILFYFEEKLFFQIILKRFLLVLSPVATILAVAVGFCLIKALQFNVTFMDLITLFLVTLVIGIHHLRSEAASWGSGYLTGIIVFFNLVLGLLVMGNEFQGALLVSVNLPRVGSEEFQVLSFLTGGTSGPFSGLGFQILIGLTFISTFFRNKNLLFNGFSKS